MLILGAILAVIAVILIVVGFTATAVQWLLWVGIGLIVVAVILALLGRGRSRV